MHDTFFIKNPAKAISMPKEYMEAVKKIHSSGGFGSKGYGYDWQEDEARKNLLMNKHIPFNNTKWKPMREMNTGLQMKAPQ